MLGWQVGFIPHKENMDGVAPNQTTIHLAQAPKRKAIAQKVQAMKNSIANIPNVTKKIFTKTMKDLVDIVKGELATFANNINLNTDRKVEL